MHAALCKGPTLKLHLSTFLSEDLSIRLVINLADINIKPRTYSNRAKTHDLQVTTEKNFLRESTEQELPSPMLQKFWEFPLIFFSTLLDKPSVALTFFFQVRIGIPFSMSPSWTFGKMTFLDCVPQNKSRPDMPEVPFAKQTSPRSSFLYFIFFPWRTLQQRLVSDKQAYHSGALNHTGTHRLLGSKPYQLVR